MDLINDLNGSEEDILQNDAGADVSSLSSDRDEDGDSICDA